ncbi:MAG TPA: hypothetical protein VLE19_01570 [Pyrinomonadaceae bacterium]|nr:hypothetical protein [Pyrinomonadaceae bacterium]
MADQIEEGKSAKTVNPSAAVTKEERQRQSRLTALHLSKARLLDQLDVAKHPAHRQVLLNGLKAIEKEIEDIAEFKLPISD